MRPGATPVPQPVLGHVRDARRDRLARVAAAERAAADATAPAQYGSHAGDRLGELALAVAGHPGDGEDLAGAHGEATTPLSASLAAVALRRRGRRPRARPRRRRRRARSPIRRRRARARPSAPASYRGVESGGRRPSPIVRPARSTVTRSATAITSSSLWEMKMIVRPSAAIARSVVEQRLGLLRGEHSGRLVEDQHARLAVERLQDLDPLLLADRQLPDRARGSTARP